MILPFEKLPDDSKAWIYQSSRKFLDIEKNKISTRLKLFLNNWTVHGTELCSGFQIKYDRFIIIALDEKTIKLQDALLTHLFILFKN